MREIKIGIRDLLDFLYRPKDLGAAGQIAPTAGQEGSAGHHLVADRRPAGYHTEIAVELAYTWENYRLVVRGRIDGLLETAECLIAEEIKTTYAPLGDLSPHEVHLAQLKLYVHFLEVDRPGKPVAGRLTYLNLRDLSEKAFPLHLAAGEGGAFFASLAISYLSSINARDRWLRIRDASLRELPFPFPERRPGQDELMDLVEQGLAQERDIFAEAAAGIGKTIGVLYPALKRLAVSDRYTQIFFLTAKTQGKLITEKTLRLAHAQGLRLRTVFIEAKERVCLTPGAGCDPELCACARDYYARAQECLTDLLRLDLMTPGETRSYATEHRLCPFELSLDLALHADLIVCDYNYVFDPGVYLRRFFLATGRKDYLFLVDEAHNLVPRGREMYSAALSEAQLSKLAADLAATDLDLVRQCEAVLEFFAAWRREMAAENQAGLKLSSLPEMLEPALEELVAVVERYLGKRKGDALWTDVRDFYYLLTRFTRLAGLINQDYAVYVLADAEAATVRLFCLNPGALLRKRLDWARAAVFFSATLSPPEYFRDLLGGKPDCLSIQLPSPFPQEGRLFVHIPGIDTRYRARDSSLSPLAGVAAELATVHTGNYLMFFPSYSYLHAVQPLIRHLLGRRAEVYAQFPNMRDGQKREFLQKVTAPCTGRSHLGLAVLGGLFGEGVDLPGEQLVGVCIVGPGLPMVSEEQELIRQYFDERNGQGFLYAYVIPGLIRVVQSAGRVFRSAEDRGVVALVDDRFLDERYQELLPPDWFMVGRPFSRADFSKVLEEFWAG